MGADRRRIFVSYSHLDEDLMLTIVQALRGINHDFPIDVWIDQNRIRAGNEWRPEIEKAIEVADLAVLLISQAFLESDFILKHELPMLLKRREDAALRLVPIQIRPSTRPKWLRGLEIRPRGSSALSEIREPASVERKLQEVVDEIKGIFEPDAAPADDREIVVAGPVAAAGIDPACAGLLTATLLADAPSGARASIAERLVGEIRRHTGLAGDGLFNAVRFFVEYQLLRAEEPTSATALEKSLTLSESPEARAVIDRLRQSGRTGDFGLVPVEVNSPFFSRSTDRAALWKRYFETVVSARAMPPDSVASVAAIRVRMGFLSPQFLVAGLLSRFDDDWRPVLNAYRSAIPNPRERRGAFESLQASQWNCWLMWGPSIPVCQCQQWDGLFALQYGYGDENNSIPVLELATGEDGGPRTLGPLVAGLRGERRGAKFAMLTGRLRWGPWFLRPYESEPSEDDGLDPVLADQDPIEESMTRYRVAPAQASLYDHQRPSHRQDSDGLVLQLERVDGAQPETRMYFSAYLWLMFLVAVPPRTPEEAAVGPRLLRHKAYPPWPSRPEERRRVQEAHLWEDLVPVFVHANIADPDALAFQRQVLVQSALHLLRQLWERRGELFTAGDVEAGIHFHLVGGSDYSGCGRGVRFPGDDPLVRQLRQRLREDADRVFAERVVLPDSDGDEPARPDGLAGYFSACHLPELIADYYEHVSQVNSTARRP